MKDIVVLIPAYDPDKKLVTLVLELIKNNFSKIILVNDGSHKKANKIFQTLKEKKECILLEYSENKGKGYAIKYGINYYLENLSNNYKGIVTCDADYQHTPNDVLNVAYKLVGNLDSFILGSRDFTQKNIPFKNRFGNRFTCFLFKLLYTVKLKDTQTGLRGIPNRYLHLCLEASGNRFEYEMNVLLKIVKAKIVILEIPIETLYYEKQKSKFNKIIDSIRIYKVLLKEPIRFMLSSLFCASIDIFIFTMSISLFSNLKIGIKIILSTFIARILADFFNFNINKNLVFNSHENRNHIFLKYYLLSFSKMILSATFVLFFHFIFKDISEPYLKIIIDTLIFLLSYKIQKRYIFKT